jgi:hypothetical protein
MAARKTKDLSQAWRQKIQTSMLINRLQSHVNGTVKLDATQVTAALGLLKKTAPDLSSVALGQDPNLEPLKVTWEQ